MILRRFQIWLTLILLCGLIISCSKKKPDAVSRQQAIEEIISKINFDAEQLLPASDSETKLTSTNTTVVLKRNEITDSTLSDSKKYMNSLVVGLVRSFQKYETNDVIIEIAQFVSPNDAYGCYSQNRPPGAAFDTLGTESYFGGNTLSFTKSNYVVNVTVQAQEIKYAAAKSIAKLIEARISQRSALPLFFRLFPYRDQLVPSQRYYSLDYLGVSLLDEVYTLDYVIDNDTMTLFMTTDTSGKKFLMLSDWGKENGELKPAPKEFDFPDAHSLSFVHAEHGQIVAGLVSRKLVGIVNYNRGSGIELGTKWVLGLK